MDRLDDRRPDTEWFAGELVSAATRFVLVRDGRLAEREGLPDGTTADDLEAPTLVGRDAAGRTVVAVDVHDERNLALAAGLDWTDARGILLRSDEPALVLSVLGYANWHGRTRFCARCGSSLSCERSGHLLRCRGCGDEHFPRIEPAMIVRVVDADGRILLGRQASWPAGFFSTLAGFVEPGETIEQAVRREVAEETSVTVGEVRYVASQPWPFPASLMLGFEAVAVTTEVEVDEDELDDARWFSRDGLRGALEAGEVRIPPPASIAHRLITDWAGQVPEGATWGSRPR